MCLRVCGRINFAHRSGLVCFLLFYCRLYHHQTFLDISDRCHLGPCHNSLQHQALPGPLRVSSAMIRLLCLSTLSHSHDQGPSAYLLEAPVCGVRQSCLSPPAQPSVWKAPPASLAITTRKTPAQLAGCITVQWTEVQASFPCRRSTKQPCSDPEVCKYRSCGLYLSTLKLLHSEFSAIWSALWYLWTKGFALVMALKKTSFFILSRDFWETCFTSWNTCLCLLLTPACISGISILHSLCASLCRTGLVLWELCNTLPS